METVHVDPAPATYVGTILTAVRSFNQSRIFGVLDDADASHGVETTIDEVIFPSLRVVGTFWSSGTIDVAHEHLLSTAVARWVAAARFGLPAASGPALVAPRGVYVCGSLKEEFGIALLEAMATGLFVVAPDGGGPATYVERGATGILTTTWDIDALRDAMIEALAISGSETTDDRATASRLTVERSFTIQAMASSLRDLYAGVHREESALLDGLVGVQ
jgi:hypothetical protein